MKQMPIFCRVKDLTPLREACRRFAASLVVGEHWARIGSTWPAYADKLLATRMIRCERLWAYRYWRHQGILTTTSRIRKLSLRSNALRATHVKTPPPPKPASMNRNDFDRLHRHTLTQQR